MKFDPFKWAAISGSVFTALSGRVAAISTDPDTAWFIETEGHEVLCHVGPRLDVTISEPVTVRIEARKGFKAAVYDPPRIFHRPAGEVFTNIDRKPNESGSMAEVTRELRKFRVQQHQLRQEMAAEKKALEQERAKLAKAKEPAPKAKEPEAKPEPVAKADQEAVQE